MTHICNSTTCIQMVAVDKQTRSFHFRRLNIFPLCFLHLTLPLNRRPDFIKFYWTILTNNDCTSYLLLYKKIIPKTQWLKTTNIFYLAHFWRVGSALAGWFWLRLSCKLVPRMVVGAVVLPEGLFGQEDLLPSLLTWLLVGSLGSLPHGPFHRAAWYVLKTWLPPNRWWGREKRGEERREKRREEKLQYLLWASLGSYTLSCPLILFIRSESLSLAHC